jgi:DNA-binding response OmpR family regulator
MLTAKDTETDLLVGLAVGADDYLAKPFSPRELVARIRTILRRIERTAQAAAAAEASGTAILRIGEIEADVATRRVHRNGELVHLTPIEFDLLQVLGARPGVVFTREQLLADVWGYRDANGARTVDSHIRSLRQKLGAALIRTVHGVGYAAAAADGD